MSTLLISYDLRSPETSEDYKRVIEYIRGYAAWAKPLYSLWFIKTSKSCAKVRDELKALTDSNDKVLVMDVTGDYWGTTFSNDHTDWMKKNV